jgi:UMF1 family MFS transporter
MGVADSYRAVWEGITSTRKYPGVRRFLIADYFFEDAVTTVILNIGLYCSIVIGLSEEAITSFLVISTISAVGGSFLMGKIARVWSLKKLLNLIVYGWVGSLLLFVFTDNMAVVWVLGSVIGILLGGLWTTSRPMLAELVPKEDLGRFFGLFSLSGRAAAVVGPLVWGAVVYTFNADRWGGRLLADTFNLDETTMTTLPYRLGVLSLVVMMAIGLFIFRKVPDHAKVDNG